LLYALIMVHKPVCIKITPFVKAFFYNSASFKLTESVILKTRFRVLTTFHSLPWPGCEWSKKIRPPSAATEAAQFWMNMWPGCLNYDNHQRDDDYDEQLTFSVRVTVHRSHLLLEYPSANLSPRLEPGSCLPPDLQFYRHRRRIDLGRAALRILPESAPGTDTIESSAVLLRERLSPKQPIILETLDANVWSEEEAELYPRQVVLFARGRREKEIILRVLEDAVNFAADELKKAEADTPVTGLAAIQLLDLDDIFSLLYYYY
jgi:hypothetical protein